MLNTNNIKSKTFETHKNGYNIEEVTAFLKQVADDYAEVVQANQDSEAKIIKLVETINQYREDEDAIKMALLTSQKEANRILADAKAKAKDMVESAKTEQVRLAEQSAAECERIVNEHKEKCAQLIKENTEATDKKIRAVRKAYDDEKAKLDDLKAEVTYFKANLTDLYNKQIRLIMELPALTDEELAKYEDEEYYDEYSEEESDAVEASAEIQDNSDSDDNEIKASVDGERMEAALNTGSFEPVIPKNNMEDLKFGKNK